VACDAIARLYDVDQNSAVFTRLDRTKKYDQGTFTFRARKDRFIDLNKLHESVWATRLSGGTRSGLVSLDVTTIGKIETRGQTTFLNVAGSNGEFLIGRHQDKKYEAAFDKLKAVAGDKTIRVSGLIDNYVGRWPNVLKQRPKNPQRLLVTKFEIVK
jgi:hypothetical protein